MRKRTIFLVVFLLFLGAGGYLYFLKSDYPVPVDLAPPATPNDSLTQELSTWNSQISFSMSDLEARLNKEIPELLLFDTLKIPDDLIIKVRRTGNFKLSVKGDSLFSSAPLKVWVHLKVNSKKLGIKIKAEKSTDFRVNVQMASKLKIESNWRVNTNTRISKFEWIEEPVVDLGLFSINLSKMAEKELLKTQDKIAGKIDEYISKQVELKPLALQEWLNMQKPIIINRPVRPIYLCITPKTFTLSKIYSKRDLLFMDVGITALIHTVVGADTLIIKDSVLPALKSARNSQRGFDLNLLAEIPFEELNMVLTDSLKGKVITYERQSVKVVDVKVFGSGTGIALSVQLSGAIDGTVYLTGNFEIDPTLQFITLNDFRYDLSTSSYLLKTGEWIFHSNLLSTLKAELDHPLETRISELPSIIEKALKKGKVGRVLVFDIQSMEFKLKKVLINKNGIQLMVNTTGDAVAEVQVDSIGVKR